MIRNTRPATQPSCKGSASWAGSSAAMCASITAGEPATSTAIARSLPNWSRSHRTRLRGGQRRPVPSRCWLLGYATVSALQKATRSVPIVFTNVIDPVGGSLVASLAQPGGYTTGFSSPEFGFAAKWLELLKEIAPGVRRVAVLRDSGIASQVALFGSIQSVAAAVGVEPRPIDPRDAGEIERAVAAFARQSNGGLIATPDAGVLMHRELIVALAARHRLPAVYATRSHVMSGGLICYGIDEVEQFRRAVV